MPLCLSPYLGNVEPVGQWALCLAGGNFPGQPSAVGSAGGHWQRSGSKPRGGEATGARGTLP